MEALLIGGMVLLLLFAIVLMVVGAKLLRENRARSTARVEALRAIVTKEVTEETETTEIAEAPVFVRPPVRQPEPFDLALRVDPPAPSRHAIVDVRSDLFEKPTPRTPGHRLAWMAATGLVMASLVGAYFVISSGVVGRIVASNHARASAAAASPIELLSLRHAIDASGNFTVTGLVQNPASSTPLHGVAAVVYLFDAEGKYFASSRAALESAVLSPGGQSGFTVRVPSPSLPSPTSLPSVPISQFRVSFQHEDGAAVIHVDRRGALPEHTSGDTVDTAPPTTPLVATRKIS